MCQVPKLGCRLARWSRWNSTFQKKPLQHRVSHDARLWKAGFHPGQRSHPIRSCCYVPSSQSCVAGWLAGRDGTRHSKKPLQHRVSHGARLWKAGFHPGQRSKSIRSCCYVPSSQSCVAGWHAGRDGTRPSKDPLQHRPSHGVGLWKAGFHPGQRHQQVRRYLSLLRRWWSAARPERTDSGNPLRAAGSRLI